jgi:hypothetical protein
MDNQLEDSAGVGPTHDLIPVFVRLVAPHLEPVPKHLGRFVLGHTVFSKLLFVELVIPLSRVERMPQSHNDIVFDCSIHVDARRTRSYGSSNSPRRFWNALCGAPYSTTRVARLSNLVCFPITLACSMHRESPCYPPPADPSHTLNRAEALHVLAFLNHLLSAAIMETRRRLTSGPVRNVQPGCFAKLW